MALVPTIFPAVFLVTLQAVAGPSNAIPDGRSYAILAFVRADSEAEAEALAFHGLDQLGWIEAQALRCGEVTDRAALPPDFEATFRRALDEGCAFIVYDDP